MSLAFCLQSMAIFEAPGPIRFCYLLEFHVMRLWFGKNNRRDDVASLPLPQLWRHAGSVVPLVMRPRLTSCFGLLVLSRETEPIAHIYFIFYLYVHKYNIFIYMFIYLHNKELAQAVLMTEKSQGIQSASWRPRTAGASLKAWTRRADDRRSNPKASRLETQDEPIFRFQSEGRNRTVSQPSSQADRIPPDLRAGQPLSF